MTAPAPRPLARETLPTSIRILLCAQLLYGLLFVWRSHFVVDGSRWFALFDDAMISMTYARTFAEGHGLLWYPDAEPVQGYTNLLWTLGMAVLHLFPLPPRWLPGVFQVASVLTVPLTALYTFRAYRILQPETVRPWLPALLAGAYFPLSLWAGLGMEAGFITFLLAFITCEMLRVDRDRRVRAALFVAMAAGVLTRLDFGLFIALAGLFLLRQAQRDRDLRLPVLAGLGSVALVTVLLCGGQWLYYGEPLPNTFFLKLGVPLETRIERGALSTGAFLASTSYVIFLVSLWLFLRQAAASAHAKCWLVATLALPLLYNVYAGGDAWEWGANANRFVLPAIPALMLCVAYTIDWLCTHSGLRGARAAGLAVLLCAVVLLRMNAGTTEPAAALSRLREAALLTPAFTRSTHDEPVLAVGLFLRDVATRPLSIAVTSAGIIPYVLGEGRFTDMLGRSDRHIAHLPPHPGEFLPGHVKWDLAYSIGTLAPDVSIGAPPGEPIVAPGQYFDSPVVRIPGLIPIFIRRSVLDEAMVPLPELVERYRARLGGSSAALIGRLLDLRGFQLRAADGAFDLARPTGTFTVPADNRLAFTMEASEPLTVTLFEDGERTRTLALEPGTSREAVIDATRDVDVRIEARRPAAPREPAPPSALSITRLAFQ